ncbi:hypothetical protein PV326_011636, partial [Microctonus aethiopoides]
FSRFNVGMVGPTRIMGCPFDYLEYFRRAKISTRVVIKEYVFWIKSPSLSSQITRQLNRTYSGVEFSHQVSSRRDFKSIKSTF